MKVFAVLSFSLLLTGLLPLIGQSESEPNNSFSEADPIINGTTYSAYIGILNDVDVFKINVTEAGVMNLVISSSPTNIGLEAYIYNPAGQEIRASTSGASGSTYILNISICEPGEYFIKLDEGGFTDTFNPDEAYMFRVDFLPFLPADECECSNGSIANSCPIAFGTPITGYISSRFGPTFSSADLDVYKLDVLSPGILEFIFQDVPSNIDIDAVIYNSSGQEIQARHESVGETFTFEVSVCDVGEYYLEIQDGNFGYVYDYNDEESFEFVANLYPFSELDTCECESETMNTACSIELCETIAAVFSPWFNRNPRVEDVDYYQVELPAGMEIDFALYNIPGSIDPRVKVMTLTGLVVDEFQSNNGEPINETFTVGTSGPYIIQVRDRQGLYQGTQQYFLQIGCNLVSSIHELLPASSLSIYPNPVHEIVYIKTHSLVYPLQYLVANIHGQVLHKGTWEENNPLHEVNLQLLPTGIYQIQVMGLNGLVSTQIIKQ